MAMFSSIRRTPTGIPTGGHNRPNPILLTLRERNRDIYDLMLDLDSSWALNFFPEEIEHARKVLDRLAWHHNFVRREREESRQSRPESVTDLVCESYSAGGQTHHMIERGPRNRRHMECVYCGKRNAALRVELQDARDAWDAERRPTTMGAWVAKQQAAHKAPIAKNPMETTIEAYKTQAAARLERREISTDDFRPATQFDYHRSQWNDLTGALNDSLRLKIQGSDNTATKWLTITPDQARRILVMLSVEGRGE